MKKLLGLGFVLFLLAGCSTAPAPGSRAAYDTEQVLKPARTVPAATADRNPEQEVPGPK